MAGRATQSESLVLSLEPSMTRKAVMCFFKTQLSEDVLWIWNWSMWASPESLTRRKTRKGELSIMVESMRILTKSLRPLPEKWHGLTDVATRYRQRYVDRSSMRTSETCFARGRSSDIFAAIWTTETTWKSKPLCCRRYTGASARPFETHHNALDMKLFMRIVELNLKRLVVGGFTEV